jgi:hypothetical protein
MQDNLQIYTLYTLVDITATGVTRGADSLERDQQRNWETVLQAVGLLAQPTTIIEPSRNPDVDLKWLDFGEFFEGNHSVWSWRFVVEHTDVFALGDNPVGQLEQVFEQVPVICGLEETARFMLPIFYPYGGIKNVYFKRNE